MGLERGLAQNATPMLEAGKLNLDFDMNKLGGLALGYVLYLYPLLIVGVAFYIRIVRCFLWRVVFYLL